MVDNERLEAVPTKVIRVGVMGDSITANGGYVRMLNELCPGYRFFNHGIGGNQTTQMRRRFKKNIFRRGYEEVIIFGGVNDIASNRSLETIQKALLGMYEAAKEKGIRVIAVTVSPWGSYQERNLKRFSKDVQEKTLMLNSWIRGLKDKGIVDAVADTYHRLVAQDGRSMKEEFRNFPKRKGDGLHPGPEGQKEIGRVVFEAAYKIRIQQMKAVTAQPATRPLTESVPPKKPATFLVK